MRGLALERYLRDADNLERRLSELEARPLRPEKEPSVPRRRDRHDAERRLRAGRRLRPRRPERPGPEEWRALYPILEKLERAPGDLAPPELVRAGWLFASEAGELEEQLEAVEPKTG